MTILRRIVKLHIQNFYRLVRQYCDIILMA